jgi:hypothetical protein
MTVTEMPIKDGPITKPRPKPRKRTTPAKRVGRPKAEVAAGPRKGAGYKYDWIDIRTKFIEGIPVADSDDREFLNLKDLAARLKVPLQRVYQVSSEEQWVAQREAYQTKLAKQRQARRIASMVKESEAFDYAALDIAKDGLTIVGTRIREISREIRDREFERAAALEAMSKGEPFNQDHLYSVIDAREIDILAKAALGWQQVGQRSTGTDITRMEIAHDLTATFDIDVEVTSIASELARDDPNRLAAFLATAKRAGLLDKLMEQDKAIEAGDDDVVDAEIVEDGVA